MAHTIPLDEDSQSNYLVHWTSREASLKPDPDLPLATEAPLDAAIVATDAADVLVETLLQDRLPGHELETEPVLDHGEAPAGKRGDAGQTARDIFAGTGRGVSQPALGRHLPADPLHLLALEDGNGPTRYVDEAVLRGGV